MKRIAPLLATLTLFACQGPTGPEGPAGSPGSPYRRTATYCNSIFADATAANSWTLSASCTDIADIPIQGWCFAALYPSDHRFPLGQQPRELGRHHEARRLGLHLGLAGLTDHDDHRRNG